MPSTLIYSSRALRDLKALPQQDHERIVSALEEIINEPGAHTRKLEGSPLFSFRVGEYRILLDIRRNTLLILVVGVGHWRTIYQRV
jgi:mRNA interferase RelE/StbE